MSQNKDDGLAVARDVSEFFDCPTGTEEDFRGVYQRLRTAQDGDLERNTSASKAQATVVLSCGEAEVSMPEEGYVSMLAEHGLKPSPDGRHSTLAILWLAQSAEKRGLTALSKSLMDLRHVSRGLVFVRRPDGSFLTSKPVSAIKVARAEETDQQAVVADVEAFFADE